MASLAELQDALANADRAGDAAAARELADAIVSMQKVEEAKPATVKAGETLKGIPRQVGLTARYGLEGPAQFAGMFTEPIRQLITDPALRAITGKQGSSPSLSTMATQAADFAHLPSPEGANERVVGDAARLMAGAIGAGSLGRLAQRAPGLLGDVGRFFAANPTQQVASAAGAGGAGGSVREAGGGPWEQAGAALLGGVGTPMALSAVMNAGRSVGSAAKRFADYVAPGAIQPQNVDQQISLVLQRSGVDWSQVPERVRQSMRAEVSKALDTGGELDPAAVNRLLAFARTGTTPTRGMLSQDPVALTREKNLAKTGANSTDLGLQRLPRLENQNTQRLLDVLDETGARNAPDEFATGQAAIRALRGNLDASRGRIDSLYSAARDTQGRSAGLDGSAFTQRATQLLDEGLLGGALPKSVEEHLNRIAKGEVPFTVAYAEQLKTTIGKLQRATNDGQARMALGMVRQALDDTPLMPAPQVNPGNLPAVPGTVPPSPSIAGEESIHAFNRARQANRAFMNRVEQTPALRAVMDGVEPDRFVRQFITGQGASVADVNQLRRAIGSDPQALEAVRGNIAAHLRSAATNATEDITKFSPASYNKALNALGDRKLSAFFSPEEIATLRDVGRAGTYMTAQPAGTAVNNSNSGALLIGKGLELLDTIAGRLPFGVNDTIQGTLRGMQQGRALSTPSSLLVPKQGMPLRQRLAPAGIYSGLLATQPIDKP